MRGNPDHEQARPRTRRAAARRRDRHSAPALRAGRAGRPKGPRRPPGGPGGQLRASLDELAGLPETFLAVDENDVLRDEGEAFARRLVEAGVPTTSVRYNATLHDFMMLNPLRGTAATTGAVEQAVHVLRRAITPG
jgi:acetyl esterase/lipase